MIEMSKEEITNTLALIQRAQITGEQATTVALLIQKLAAMLKEATEPTPPSSAS